MCLPIAAIGAAITSASPYLWIPAAAASTFGALQQGAAARSAANQNAANAMAEAQVAQAAAEYNARNLEQRASERTQIASADADRQQQRNRILQGQARANAAASGLQLEGSPLEVLAWNAGQQAQDVETILLQGRMDSRDMLAEAELERWRGQNALVSGASQAAAMRRQGQQAQRASLLSAGGSLLTGGSSWASRYGTSGGTKTGANGAG